MFRSHHGPPTAPSNDTGQPTIDRDSADPTDRIRTDIIARAAQRENDVFTRVMDMELAHRMLDVVAQIPAGAVATYGDVAARAGSRSARLAGFVLSHLSDDDTPWHRVVRANGTPAPQLAREQISRLRSEGVEVVNGRVNLRRYRWHV
jgi:alkylated DNA nucleotide flippase Atl1